MGYSKTVDEFFAKPSPYAKQLAELRQIMLDAGMEETLKWGSPVYVAHGKNIAGISAFKSYVGIWFFQGALLSDVKGVLMNAQEGKTVAMRQWRFQKDEPLDVPLISSYIREAMANAREGREIKPAKAKPLVLPLELKEALKSDDVLKQQFDQLSKSCRREYAEYIGEAKREDTRMRRLEKSLALIREKKGLHDKYT
ncbi:MAG: DUF1801 domain-containing protein [Saprospiraceae bacterium]|nr:DUF1801 domain-containing protein [Saprospiraceae bacterium]